MRTDPPDHVLDAVALLAAEGAGDTEGAAAIRHHADMPAVLDVGWDWLVTAFRCLDQARAADVLATLRRGAAAGPDDGWADYTRGDGLLLQLKQ
jgi:hypothetical protein